MGSGTEYLIDPDESSRERSRRRGHIASLHTWWGRRTLVTARAAVFRALAPQSEADLHLLKQICVHQPRPADLQSARQQIKLEHARKRAQDDANDAPANGRTAVSDVPRVLDLFAGGGSIPLETLRLGAQAYAVDLDPIAYLIELCTLSYPQQYAHPSRAFVGSGENGEWMGLTQEVRHWANWIQEHAAQELRNYYPERIMLELEGQRRDVEPLAYIWIRTVVCPVCGIQTPVGRPVKLAEGKGQSVTLAPQFDPNSKQLVWVLEESAGDAVAKAHSSRRVGSGPQCLACGSAPSFEQVRGSTLQSTLAGLVYRREHNQTVEYASQHMLSNIGLEPSNEQIQQALLSLQKEYGLAMPDEPLPPGGVYGASRYGFTAFGALFTSRQALSLLTYCKWIHRSYDAMMTTGVSSDRATAITGYLGLMMSEFAQRRSAMSTWNPRLRGPRPIFGRGAVPMTWEFAEVNPVAADFAFTDRIDNLTSVIDECGGVGHPAVVERASATRLPFADGYFDAVVTDPPYYDAAPYADLSAFFYVWLKRSVGSLFSQGFASQLPSSQDEIVVATHRHGGDQATAQEAYWRLMQQALQEAARVLKSNCLMTLVFNSRDPDTLRTLLELAQKAGFELYSAERIEPLEPQREREHVRKGDLEIEAEEVGLFLLAFRKVATAAQLTEPTADAAILLELTQNDQPTLYAGLAELLEGELPSAEIARYIPVDFIGSERDKLIEFVATVSDLELFLVQELGNTLLRRIATSRGWMGDSDQDEAPAQIILHHLGFNVPKRPEKGVTSAIQRLRELISQVKLANTPNEIEGCVLDGMKRIEDILKASVFAWARAICQEEANGHLLRTLQEIQNEERHFSLDRLTMGHVIGLFCRLPDHFAEDERLRFVCQALVGRPHIYKVGKQQTELNEITGLRNRVAHDTQSVNANHLDEMRKVSAECLEKAVDVLTKLKDRGAIPLVGQPVRESRDVFNRRTTTLNMEDGTVREVFVAVPLTLGENYWYLAERNNPRAIDPLLIPLSVRSENTDEVKANVQKGQQSRGQ